MLYYSGTINAVLITDVKICVKDHKVLDSLYVCRGSSLSCNIHETISVQKLTFITKNGTCGLFCQPTEFIDTSEFSNLLYELCSMKQQCDLNGRHIKGSMYGFWMAEIQYSCLPEGRILRCRL